MNTNHLKLKQFLPQWDKSSKKQKISIVQRFVDHFQFDSKTNVHVYQLDHELGDIAPLFFSRLLSQFQLLSVSTSSSLLLLLIEALSIFFHTQSQKEYVTRFVDCGGFQTVLMIMEQQEFNTRINAHILLQCLNFLYLVMKCKSSLKSVFCMLNGVQTLLLSHHSQLQRKHRDNDKQPQRPKSRQQQPNENSDDLLYTLLTFLKFLCRRNIYANAVHGILFEHICDPSTDIPIKKALLKVLQCTMDVTTTVGNHATDATAITTATTTTANKTKTKYDVHHQKPINPYILHNHDKRFAGSMSADINSTTNRKNIDDSNSNSNVSHCSMDAIQSEKQLYLRKQSFVFKAANAQKVMTLLELRDHRLNYQLLQFFHLLIVQSAAQSEDKYIQSNLFNALVNERSKSEHFQMLERLLLSTTDQQIMITEYVAPEVIQHLKTELNAIIILYSDDTKCSSVSMTGKNNFPEIKIISERVIKHIQNTK